MNKNTFNDIILIVMGISLAVATIGVAITILKLAFSIH